MGEASTSQCICKRGDGGCHRSHCRSRGSSRPAIGLRLANDGYLPVNAGCVVSLENPGAGAYRVCRGCRYAFAPGLKPVANQSDRDEITALSGDLLCCLHLSFFSFHFRYLKQTGTDLAASHEAWENLKCRGKFLRADWPRSGSLRSRKMCGIVGFFSRKRPVSQEVLQRATRSLYHRGPDGQRHWVSEDERAGLGHARLSIIDLSGGEQPIASEDGRTRIVVNGEFYGYEAIQRELENAGHRLRTRSDSEIVLHLYEDLGTQCLHRLRGEFAFVLWDETHRTIFAARDRFGIKPLFHAFHEDTLYLASEVKALFAAGVPARWDAESVYHSIELGGHQMRTLYDGVFQVPPGHYLIATDKNIQIHQYWDFDYPKANGHTGQRSDGDYAEEFREALEESVRVRLRADVPVGCYLSGGLDSCAVLGPVSYTHLRAHET